uniref:Potassium channel domain-containing protein n=1 Tax=Parascaris equorum TaxID=6256 RepID=A0A914RR03_PAREQ
SSGKESDYYFIAIFAINNFSYVGYGFVTPTTETGRLLIIIYGLIGAPLILVTLTDVGKFISFYSTKFLPSSDVLELITNTVGIKNLFNAKF